MPHEQPVRRHHRVNNASKYLAIYNQILIYLYLHPMFLLQLNYCVHPDCNVLYFSLSLLFYTRVFRIFDINN
jgi:hypothetical protein